VPAEEVEEEESVVVVAAAILRASLRPTDEADRNPTPSARPAIAARSSASQSIGRT
jgi:hypothetical protein